jgi:hypothetical protein
LGKLKNVTDLVRAAGTQVIRDKAGANEHNRWAEALVQAYRQQGLSWLAIAGKLNGTGFKASRGGDSQPVQVPRYKGFMRGSVIDADPGNDSVLHLNVSST